MSLSAMDAVWDRGPARHSHLIVLLRIADNINDATGEWQLSVGFIAEHARLSERQVQRILNALNRENWLLCKRKANQATVFSLGPRLGWQPSQKKGGEEAPGGVKGDNLSPRHLMSPGGDIRRHPGVTSGAAGGDIQVSPIPPTKSLPRSTPLAAPAGAGAEPGPAVRTDPQPPGPTHQPFHRLSWEFYRRRTARGDAFFDPWDAKLLKICKHVVERLARGNLGEALRRVALLEALARPGDGFWALTPQCLSNHWARIVDQGGPRRGQGAADRQAASAGPPPEPGDQVGGQSC